MNSLAVTSPSNPKAVARTGEREAIMADTIKTILAPATGDPSDAMTLDAALMIARAFSAHIDVLHVRVDPLDVAAVGDAVMTSIVDQIERDADEQEASV